MDRQHGYYEQYWSSAGVAPEGLLLPAVRRVVNSSIPAGAACLDVGCGDGRAAGPYLLSRGCSYLGADISANALERANALGFRTQLIDDAASLPWPDGSFDAVVSFEVLEHLFDPMAALTEMKRVLRPGGVVVLTVPNVAYWTRRVELAFLGRWNPLGDTQSVQKPWRDPHIRFFTTKALRSFLEEAGWARIRVGGHSGAAIAHLPGLRSLRRESWKPEASSFYRMLEERSPSFFGYGLFAVAFKPREGREVSQTNL